MEAAVIAVVAMVASVFPPQKKEVKELLKVSRPQVKSKQIDRIISLQGIFIVGHVLFFVGL